MILHPIVLLLATTTNPTSIFFRKLKWGESTAKECIRGLEEAFVVGHQPAPTRGEGREGIGLTTGTASLAETTKLTELEIQCPF